MTSDAGGDVYVDGVAQGRRARHHQRLPAGRPRRRGPQGRLPALAPDRHRRRPASRSRSPRPSAPPTGSPACASSPASPTSRSSSTARTRARRPSRSHDVKPGEHIVEGRKAKFKALEQTVRVAAGENADRPAQDGGRAARPAARATLKVQSTVPNAEVFVDGSSLGRAPVDRNDLGSRQALRRRPQGRLHRLQARGHPDREPAGRAGRRPAATGGAAHPLDARGRRRAHRRRADRQDARAARRRRRRRSRHRVQAQGLLRPQGDHQDRGRPEKVFSVDLKALPTRPDARAVTRRKQGMSSFGAQGQPGGRRHRRLRRRLPLLLHGAAHRGAFASSRWASTWASSSRPSSRSPTWRCTAGCSWWRRGRCRSRCAATSAAAPAPTAATPTSST